MDLLPNTIGGHTKEALRIRRNDRPRHRVNRRSTAMSLLIENKIWKYVTLQSRH